MFVELWPIKDKRISREGAERCENTQIARRKKEKKQNMNNREKKTGK